jgi:VanZ family protein
MSNKTRWMPLIVYMLALVALSVGPTLPSDGKLAGISIDKLYHAGAYAIMGVLVARAVTTSQANQKGLGSVAAVLVATLACLLFGAAIEILQCFTPPRTASLLDTAADGIGGVAGSTLFAVTAWLRSEKEPCQC